MNILIIGGQFQNKGAYLMVMTVIKEIRERDKEVNIVFSNYLELPKTFKEYNIKLLKTPLLHVGFQNKQFKRYLNLGPIVNYYKSFTKGQVSLKDIDIIIDIAGFAYGDLWGLNPIINLNYLLDRLQKYHVKYIALPQAFGPFEKEGMKDEMSNVIKKSELIFARDRISKSYLDELAGENSNKIKSAPDITLSIENTEKELKSNEKYCCLVPNVRMLDKGDDAWKDEYVTTLVNIGKYLISQNIKVKILVHDTTSGDEKIANEIISNIDSPICNIIKIEDPIEIKSLISKSMFLVGSRFHSLASALSCNIPSVGMGWSHKYQMLFEDYGMDLYVFEKPDKEKIMQSIKTLVNEESNQEIKEQLLEKNKIIKTKNSKMWEDVFSIIRKGF